MFYAFPICSYCKGEGCFVCDNEGVTLDESETEPLVVVCPKGHFYTPQDNLESYAQAQLDDKGRSLIDQSRCQICTVFAEIRGA